MQVKQEGKLVTESGLFLITYGDTYANLSDKKSWDTNVSWILNEIFSFSLLPFRNGFFIHCSKAYGRLWGIIIFNWVGKAKIQQKVKTEVLHFCPSFESAESSLYIRVKICFFHCRSCCRQKTRKAGLDGRWSWKFCLGWTELWCCYAVIIFNIKIRMNQVLMKRWNIYCGRCHIAVMMWKGQQVVKAV